MSKSKKTEGWEQLALCDGPFLGGVTPMEFDRPSWPDEAWDVLRVLHSRVRKEPALSVESIAKAANRKLSTVERALAVLAPYECAVPVIENGEHRWRPGRRSRDIYRRWKP
jgi:hypothetical protein